MKYFAFAILLSFVTTACGLHPLAGDAYPSQYTMDGLKQITAGNEDPSDSSAFDQMSYELSQSSRLLLRYESLSSHVSEVYVSDKSRVQLQITLAPKEMLNEAEEVLHVCPLTKNWMMLATWSAAHPFNTDGLWTRPGGDYDESSCVSKYDRKDDTLTFDMTEWFMNYPRGRNVNYGLLLTSDRVIKVVGEVSGTHSPRILWNATGTAASNMHQTHTK